MKLPWLSLNLNDPISRYRLAALLLGSGIALDLVWPDQLASWIFRGLGFLVLLIGVIVETWKVHQARRHILGLAYQGRKHNSTRKGA